jgi:Domain of unknown function (DUF4430)
MTHRSRRALRALSAVLLAGGTLFAPSALAAPAAVNLRIEGASRTTFEDRITTDGHAVTTASGGTHECDGTNGGVNPTAGPTATAALDDGARLGGFSWDGTHDTGFDDYLVSRIGPDSQTATQFWALLVNSEFSSVGGCQQRVKAGDEVLWAFDGFSKQHALHLSGPTSAHTGQPFTVRVTDGNDGSTLAGASVGGRVTGADGRATVELDAKGVHRLKAERADSIRSNALSICVDPPGAEPCTSFDGTAPNLRLTLPGTIASEGSRSRTIRVDWLGDDGAAGSGVTTYDVDVRKRSPAAADSWRKLADDTILTGTHFRGESGGTYDFRASATDRAGNTSGFVHGVVIVPVDDRDRRLLRISRGWTRLERRRAWGRRVIRSRRKGARARLRFRGSAVALIGRKLPKGGWLRVSVDGHSKVIRLRGRPRFRRVLFMSKRRRPGSHTLRLKALGGGKVELDAIAPIP